MWLALALASVEEPAGHGGELGLVAGPAAHRQAPFEVGVDQLVGVQLRRVRRQEVQLDPVRVLTADTDLDLLIAMRNGAAHAAPNSAQAKGMISPLAWTIETLLNDLGKPLDAFWERWTDAVKNAVNEQDDQVFRDVQLRITQAKHAFDDRFAGLRAEVKVRALTVPKSALSEWVETVEIRSGGVPVLKASGGDCPACGGRGVLTFEPTHQTGTDTHYSSNGFACSMCGLQVNGPDEMAALRKANTAAPGTVTSVTVPSAAATLSPTTTTIKIGRPQAK